MVTEISGDGEWAEKDVGSFRTSIINMKSSNDPVGHPGITQMINRIRCNAVVTKGKYQLNKTVYVSVDIYLCVCKGCALERVSARRK